MIALRAAVETVGVAHWISGAWLFLNGNFGLALISALAGSFAGAIGAQCIAERQGKWRALKAEFRAANAATALAISTVNVVTSLKRQHVAAMVKRYNHDRQRLMAAHAGGQGTFAFTADWETLPWTDLPIQPLSEAIFQQLHASPATITLMTMVGGATTHLRSVIDQRNEFIHEVRTNPKLTEKHLAALYFGVSIGGHTDRRYQGLMSALEAYSDAAILFSAILADELTKHAKRLKRELGWGAPKATDVDLHPLFSGSLMPDPLAYGASLRPIGIDPRTVLARHRGPRKPGGASPPNWIGAVKLRLRRSKR